MFSKTLGWNRILAIGKCAAGATALTLACKNFAGKVSAESDIPTHDRKAGIQNKFLRMNPVGERKYIDINTKRTEDVLSWDDYFMAIAFLSGQRSKDPVSQVGACIVNKDKVIVATGYNGMPSGIHDDELSWKKRNQNDELDQKHLYVCHAELNAILNKNSADVKGCTLYVSLFPCNECTKLVIQSGIGKVIYASDKHADKTGTKASKRMLNKARIDYEQFKPKRNPITIDFGSIEFKPE